MIKPKRLVKNGIKSTVSTTTVSNHLIRLKARRKLWLNVHLYLGLVAGAILVVVGLSGAILVFYHELQDVIDPELNTVSAPPEGIVAYRPLDDIIVATERVKPKGGQLTKLLYPRNAQTTFKLFYFIRSPKQNNNGDGYIFYVDPYTAEVRGQQLWYPKDRYWGRPLLSFIMQLHWCLLLGKNGSIIVGILAVLSIISVLTGLIVWWPLTGRFGQALSIKRKTSTVRFNYDLHKTVGFYSTLVLIPVLFSGVYFNLPEHVNVVVERFTSLSRKNAFSGISDVYHSAPAHAQITLSPGQIETIVQRLYPSGKLWMIRTPLDERGVYKIWKRDVPELGHFIGYRDIAIDRYSGRVVKVYDSGSGSAGDILMDWQWPLHSGHAFGWPGRILVLLSGLACPLLFATGVIRWLQKRRAAAAKRLQ